MSKKRVHEIAKELKSHGIELDNKEVVTELVSLGYDVKSHSSSLEDDQAVAAIQKILDKRKPKAAPPPVAPKGFMVRRKVGADAHVQEVHQPPPAHGEPAYAPHAPVSHAPPAAAEPPPAPVQAAEPEPAQEPEVQAPPEPAQVEETRAAAELHAPTAHVEPPPAAPPVSAEPPAVAAPSPENMPEVAPAPSVAPEPPPAPAVQPAQPAQPAAAAPPSAPARAEPPAAPARVDPSRPFAPARVDPNAPLRAPQTRSGSSAAVVVRPPPTGSRPPLHAPARVTVRPGQPPARPGSQFRQSAQAQPPAPGTDPRTVRPTATQAVVISRPTGVVRRVTPSSTAHRSIPLAPGRKAIGEVREFKVVPDHLGRGRELVDVTKKKEGAKKRTTEKEGSFSTQEIKDLVFGRVTIPIRGKKKKPTKKGAKTQITEMAEEKKVIKLQEGISVSDLGQRMGVKTTEIIKKLMQGGKMATANQILDADTATIIATDYGWRVEKVGFEVEDYLPEVEANTADERPRPPVVTVMGHVDHGKTSLLDAIRAAKVAEGEAGGITQHIGAYTVRLEKGDITFLDTPGHEAFTAMRARGSQVTDIVVLVVAADDSVMPTTIEAIKHAKAAEVPIVVAINKMDLGGANPDRVKKDLATHELVPEDWGGDTIMVPVSARTKMGIDLLLENLLLQAEVLELKANPSRPAVGTVIEAKIAKGRGPVASVLVQEGTLRVGDAVVTGTEYGRIRGMTNDRGESIEEVLPGYSAELIGLSGVPTAGESIHVVEDERAAKEIAGHREMKERQAEAGKTSRDSLDALFARTKAGEAKVLNVVLKADVQGSLEAVSQAITKLSTSKVKVEIVHKGVGMVTESDVARAATAKGLVLGFNVRPESGSEAAAKAQEVDIETYTIIYELVDKVRAHMEDLLEPIRTEKKLGRAEVRNLFNVPKLGTIAGSAVIEGTIKRSAMLRLLRENKQIFTGKIASLRRFKDDVREVAQGYECGIGIDGYSDLKPGDIIEAYEIEETRPSLS